MRWAGSLSWLLGQGNIPPITRGLTRAAEPWVKTNSGSLPTRQLTSGSDLNKPAEGPWAPLIDSSTLIFDSGAAWRPNAFREVTVTKRGANYGSITSLANFGFRSWTYPANGPTPSIGMLPGPAPSGRRPMWNNLPPMQYNLRVANPTRTKVGQRTNKNVNAYSVGGNPYNGSASLNRTGAYQGEVIV